MRRTRALSLVAAVIWTCGAIDATQSDAQAPSESAVDTTPASTDPVPATSSAAIDAGTYAVRLRDLEQRVNELKGCSSGTIHQIERRIRRPIVIIRWFRHLNPIHCAVPIPDGRGIAWSAAYKKKCKKDSKCHAKILPNDIIRYFLPLPG